MGPPRVSVIIPAYNQANFLGQAIQSVLDQTYPSFEVIIVNDGSPDNTHEIVRQMKDPRIKYVVHDKNLGLTAARNTGVTASSGEIIAMLDADDLFHREKIERHLAFLEEHPEIGATYNARFEIDPVGNVLSLWRPPTSTLLSDLVLGFPFAPSDLVVRRRWISRTGLTDKSYVFFGEDLSTFCRLALAGCQFSSVDRFLNFRRLYPGRIERNVNGALEAMLRALKEVFADPRCPAEVKALHDVALANKYLSWSFWAFVQEDTALGQELIRQAVRLHPSILEGGAAEIVRSFLSSSIRDGGEHEPFLRSVIAQMPPELQTISQRCERAVADGYLVRGVRDVIWGRQEAGYRHLRKAVEFRACLDEPFLRWASHELYNYEEAFGYKLSGVALHRVARALRKVGARAETRWLQGCYLTNRAFKQYRSREYSGALRSAFNAIFYNPSQLTNRGIVAMLLHSLANACSHRVQRSEPSRMAPTT